MRFILASSYVPFVNGGARFIVEWLEQALLERGHEVERFYLPFTEDPDSILDQMAAFRLMDLSAAGDRLITFRPPAHLLRHPHKILWFIHHIRAYYDLWDSPYGPPPTPNNLALREAVRNMDNVGLREARAVFTNSQVVADRLATFNNVVGTPLFPPLQNPERFTCAEYGEEILVVCRVEAHKRQLLMVKAMAHVRTPVRLRLCGQAADSGQGEVIWAAIETLRVRGRVSFENRWISETEKAHRLSRALAVAYLPEDEDSYGYPVLEAAYAHKAVITAKDSGGVLEMVDDQINGFVCDPSPKALAQAMDKLYLDRRLAQQMGNAHRTKAAAMNIDWDHVVQALTQ